ncbi:MAG: Na(+)-translocating NADH-quinone reductase subunit A [Flavobacteriales bacterium]
MSRTIKIRKGANIRLVGAANENLVDASTGNIFAVKPTDFHGLVPKLLLKEGAEVKIGTPIFYDKANEDIKYVSPVSGEIAEIVRGAKRKIMEVRILSDSSTNKETLPKLSASSSKEEVTRTLLASGLWPFILQRPFSAVAKPSDTPKAFYVSTFSSAPLAPNPDFVMSGNEKAFEAGLSALSALAGGAKVQLGVKPGSSWFNQFSTQADLTTYDGPHPAGNVGVQIHKTNPINKGEVVWYCNAQDVVNIGKTITSGEYSAERIVAVTGSEVITPQYVKTKIGAQIKTISGGNLNDGKVRQISGDVLTGEKVNEDGFLGFYDTQISAVPEGDEPQFFLTDGWLSPGLNKFSLSKSFPTWLLPKSKKFKLNTNMNGEERKFVMTGQYEKVFPFDIYPQQLVKSIMVNDIDMMEKLGIYEVAPEDFALCEYACTSKIEVQDIVREGLDVIMEEFK